MYADRIKVADRQRGIISIDKLQPSENIGQADRSAACLIPVIHWLMDCGGG
ncbi:hypothetical protein [Paenibacillus bouchesdurhonensis]|uniref:hypothetical protein n=1 Tax=Paenibacillus bouchesdurhonensis TaxID=1870990 RepID=UPI001F2A26E1|nr:hypothetical protein [Paenibacillus bouchesdurhonensis]